MVTAIRNAGGEGRNRFDELQARFLARVFGPDLWPGSLNGRAVARYSAKGRLVLSGSSRHKPVKPRACGFIAGRVPGRRGEQAGLRRNARTPGYGVKWPTAGRVSFRANPAEYALWKSAVGKLAQGHMVRRRGRTDTRGPGRLRVAALVSGRQGDRKKRRAEWRMTVRKCQ